MKSFDIRMDYLHELINHLFVIYLDGIYLMSLIHTFNILKYSKITHTLEQEILKVDVLGLSRCF